MGQEKAVSANQIKKRQYSAAALMAFMLHLKSRHANEFHNIKRGTKQKQILIESTISEGLQKIERESGRRNASIFILT